MCIFFIFVLNPHLNVTDKKLPRKSRTRGNVTRAKVNTVIMRRNNTACLGARLIENRKGAEDENYTARGTEGGLYTRSWLRRS